MFYTLFDFSELKFMGEEDEEPKQKMNRVGDWSQKEIGRKKEYFRVL